MARLAKWIRLATLVCSAALFTCGTQTAVASSGVPKADYAKANHERCLEDNSVMVRKHPDYLKHQRDETMHHGIRTSKYSLKKCMDCHAEKDATGKSTGKTDCDTCHAYAAVKLDCWDCHAKKNVTPRQGKPLQSQPSPMMSSVQAEGAK